MNEQRASFGVLKATTEEGPRYLLQYNHKWRWFNLVGGKSEPNETPRLTLIRELGEELNLIYLKEFTVSSAPLTLYETTQLSNHELVLTHYFLSVFAVSLIGSHEQILQTLQTLAANPDNIWVNARDIKLKLTAAKQPISDLVLRILEAVGEL